MNVDPGDPRAGAWYEALRRSRLAEREYHAAAEARDELVCRWRDAGATWGELAALTGLDRAQLHRMAARARSRTGNDSQSG